MGEDSSPPINLVRGYPLSTDMGTHRSGGDPPRQPTLRGGNDDGNGIDYPTVRSGRSGRFAPPPALGPLTTESALSRSRPGTLERRRATGAGGELDGEEGQTEPGSRTLERRRREGDLTTERRRREEEALMLERQRRREAEAAEERARERLYEPPITQFQGRGESGGGSYFNGGDRNTLDRNLKSFSAPNRR